MWKKILIGFVVFIGVVIVAVMFLTSGMTKVAENFFSLVESNQYDKAYMLLSDDFKHSVSKDKLNTFIKSNGFDQYKSASWGNRSINGKRGVLEGSIDTKNGGSIPVEIKLIKGENGWKIFSIIKPKSGLIKEGSSSSELVVPNQAIMESLITNSVYKFALSVNAKNMQGLYDVLSERFKSEITPEKLTNAFKAFYKTGADLTVLKDLKPIIDKSYMDGKLLRIEGYYDTHPSRVNYKLAYSYENKEWKLSAISINMKNASK